MRIWNLPCGELDDAHLLGEHGELHGLWAALTQGKRAWANHPETRRFRGRLGALYRRHEEQVAEMARRGWAGHRSPPDAALVGADAWEWPPVCAAEIERDRRDLAARAPEKTRRRSAV
ncbi:MAG: pyrimidine dimer DNA glycosylase [Chloroflexi bacterium]|nr:pyrimidine dimer DNA glycosylase [Chloroflexota bacterium]